MIWTSSLDAVEVGGTTLPGMVRESTYKHADRPALIDGDSGMTVSYSLLGSRIDAVAAGLRARGFGLGDVLALWAPNIPPWVGVALGAMSAGGAVTGISPAFTAQEASTQLTDARASVLVTVPPLVPDALTAAAPVVRDVVVIGEAPGAVPLASVLAAEPREAAAPASESTIAFLPFSSGTTGRPKGVELTHRNLVAQVRQIQAGLRLTSEDTLLAVVPFCHVMGFVVHVAVALSAGATVVTMPRFDPEKWLGLIQRHRVSVLVAPPPLMAVLARHPAAERHDLTSVRVVVSGGAPLSAELHRAVAARLPGAVVNQAWGLTEATLAVTIPDRAHGTVPGSVGRLAPNTALRVDDPETGRDPVAGQRGELWVHGPQLMSGYRNQPEATAATIDAAGWLHTGDIGYVDGDENIYVVDRLKELIKVNAYQVAPAELEAVLMTYPGVNDAAVVGREHPDYGEVPVAVVVANDGVSAEALMEWVADRVAPYKRIRAVRFVDEVPRTAAGKVLRRLLADTVADATFASAK